MTHNHYRRHGALGPHLLTPRQIEVCELIAEGCTNREIAQRLNIAERTVRTHVSSALSTLGLFNRTQVAMFMAVSGKTSLEEMKASLRETVPYMTDPNYPKIAFYKDHRKYLLDLTKKRNK